MKKLKTTAVLLSFFVLFGCSSKPPKQTQPIGELHPVYEKQSEFNERGVVVNEK